MLNKSTDRKHHEGKESKHPASSQKNWFAKFKHRASPFYSSIILIHLAIFALQATGWLPIPMRLVAGIFEIGLSIFISYRFGYAGMTISIATNSIATISMIVQGKYIYEVSQDLIKYSAHATKETYITKEIVASAPKLFYCLAASRVAVIAASVMVAYAFEQAQKHIQKLEWLTNIDGMTGVYNHRYFQTRLDEEIVRADSYDSQLGMVIIDVDNFKKYNDVYGHKAGDILLSKTAGLFQAETRLEDIVFRYGGDEFVILMPETTPEELHTTVERIRKSFEKMVFMDKNDRLFNDVTLSIGFSLYPYLAKNKEELFIQADSALYQAKNSGRNNVKLYKDVFEDIKSFFGSDEYQLFGGLRALLGTVSAKDKYTLGHSERVMDYAILIGTSMGLNLEQIKLLKIAALLHDIGKVEIPETLLNKRSPLSKSELNLLRRHPVYSAEILEPLSNINHLIKIVKHHHERYDGKGYPDRISGGEIPLESRILCIADSFDAMLSNRPYRKSMGIEKVLIELKKCAGSQFDPEIVQVFLLALDKESNKSRYSIV